MIESDSGRRAPPMLRLLFADPNADWRARFECVQAWLAFDHPVSIAFTRTALEFLRVETDSPRRASAAAFGSLRPLGFEHAFAPASAQIDSTPDNLVLPVIYLSPEAWRTWLRVGPLVVN